MAGFARKMDGGGLITSFVRKVARTFERTISRNYPAQEADGMEICAADFDRIVACKENPPNPSEAIIQATQRYHARRARRS